MCSEVAETVMHVDCCVGGGPSVFSKSGACFGACREEYALIGCYHGSKVLQVTMCIFDCYYKVVEVAWAVCECKKVICKTTWGDASFDGTQHPRTSKQNGDSHAERASLWYSGMVLVFFAEPECKGVSDDEGLLKSDVNIKNASRHSGDAANRI